MLILEFYPRFVTHSLCCDVQGLHEEEARARQSERERADRAEKKLSNRQRQMSLFHQDSAVPDIIDDEQVFMHSCCKHGFLCKCGYIAAGWFLCLQLLMVPFVYYALSVVPCTSAKTSCWPSYLSNCLCICRPCCNAMGCTTCHIVCPSHPLYTQSDRACVLYSRC